MFIHLYRRTGANSPKSARVELDDLDRSERCMKLDDIHIGMLDLLRKNGGLSIAALAKQLAISRSSAYQRYEALIEAGVITGFTATLDFGATGLDISALVFVSIEQNRWQEFR